MKLDAVIDDIVESYQTHNEISKVDAIRQPDKAVIIDLLERLQDIIFPGFFGRKGLKSDYVKYYLGDQIQIIYNDLKNILSSTDMELLRIAQKDWVIRRDKRAEEDSKMYGSNSTEEIEYTKSLADSTKERYYELIENYLN